MYKHDYTAMPFMENIFYINFQCLSHHTISRFSNQLLYTTNFELIKLEFLNFQILTRIQGVNDYIQHDEHEIFVNYVPKRRHGLPKNEPDELEEDWEVREVNHEDDHWTNEFYSDEDVYDSEGNEYLFIDRFVKPIRL